jgi:hypothetical protein
LGENAIQRREVLALDAVAANLAGKHYGAFVCYLRVSTKAQGQSGLGLDAQRQAVADYLNGGRWSLIAEYVEVESGANDDRPRLGEALARCRLHNATLVIAKLDRLSRDAHFPARLAESRRQVRRRRHAQGQRDGRRASWRSSLRPSER